MAMGEIVALRGGFLVPVKTIELLLRLEGRGEDNQTTCLPPGYRPRVEDGRVVVTSPSGQPLTKAQSDALKDPNLKRLIEYCERCPW